MKPLKDQEPPYADLQKHAKELAKEMQKEDEALQRLKKLAGSDYQRNIVEKEIIILSSKHTIN